MSQKLPGLSAQRMTSPTPYGGLRGRVGQDMSGEKVTKLRFLLVGAGGGGGSAAASNCGGGGAGGQMRTGTMPFRRGVYPVVVGVGGNGSPSTDGANSTCNGLTALGGARGGDGGAVGGGGYNSGGGGAATASSSLAGAAAHNAGADAIASVRGGGGGGEGGAASAITGGIGVSDDITGSAVTYGAGADGGSYAGDAVGASGTANRGNGGAGASGGSSRAGGTGSDGLFVLRYLTNTLSATGGVITTVGNYTLHTFTASGNFTVF